MASTCGMTFSDQALSSNQSTNGVTASGLVKANPRYIFSPTLEARRAIWVCSRNRWRSNSGPEPSDTASVLNRYLPPAPYTPLLAADEASDPAVSPADQVLIGQLDQVLAIGPEDDPVGAVR